LAPLKRNVKVQLQREPQVPLIFALAAI